MAQHISLYVDLDSLEINRSKNITGTIYFIIDYHRYFPDEGWDDFLVIILSWWIKSIRSVDISRIGTTYKFDFMDGTPEVLVKKVSEDQVEMNFSFEDDLNESFKGTFLYKELKDSLLSVSKQVIRELDRNQWIKEDIDEFKNLVLSLERYPFKNHT
ncbi:hypothetical protein CEQ21_04860 [Niallia circulans]|uniref:Uncharacterized protein n=1 Tax=Niallia circulans TaxID=1397 RepID=A0A553STE4_NIACI|nr:hypothetical protein [Niallia circulans]TRZ40270.1 hypothetical protein CEQ21_04860 [Niallia circulans]